MTRWLSSLMARWRRDQADRDYLPQMRELWRVPPDWQHRTTARVVRKPRAVEMRRNDRKAS